MHRTLLALGVALLVSAAANAQTARPGYGKVHRMEISNGLTQSVRYFGSGLKPTDQATLRDLEQLENQRLYARNLLSLKREYVASEELLEPFRRDVKRRLYNQATAPAASFPVAYAPYGSYGYYGAYNGGFGAPLAYPGYTFSNAVPVGYGFGGGLATGALLNGGGLLNAALDEDNPIKSAMARTMATQATPEYLAKLDQERDRIVKRAAASPTLAAALDLPRESRYSGAERLNRPRGSGGIRSAAGETGAGVVLTLKSGEKVSGTKMTEKGDWLILERGKAGRVRVRASEVTRIDEAPGSGGVRGASD